MIDARLILTAVVVTGLSVWATLTVDGWLEKDRPTPEPDTVEVERTITKTDTITETRARTVRVYDTVETTERIYVSVPTDWNPQGVIGTRPVDISDDEVTLTYFHEDRWEQKVYDVPRDRWRLDLHTNATAMMDAALATATVQVRRRGTLGWIGVGPSYSVVATDKVYTGWGATVTYNTTLFSR